MGSSSCPECGRGWLPDTEYYNDATLPPDPEFAARRQAETSTDISNRLGPYVLQRRLGQGGMGVVWEAEHQETGRRVALKVLPPDVTGNEEAVERFVREGRLAASLSHPRSTFIFGAGEYDGQPYIAMELMPGTTLGDLVHQEGPLPINRAVDLILDVIDGLIAAHELGVIHRDVKPSNCFLDGDGRAKVGDFGLSKSLVSDAQLTRTGAFMGTPLFAAPEQVRGAQVDERTDIYAVGATLFYLLAGRGPFDGDAMSVVAQIVSDPPKPLRDLRPEAPSALEQIIARTLEKDPQRRFASLARLRQALRPFASGGTGIAQLGRRLAAYMLDAIAGALVSIMLIMMYLLVWTVSSAARGELSPTDQASSQADFQVLLQIVNFFVLVGYFALAEGIWGRGVGKWAMGLRVVNMQGETPGIARALLRSFFIPGTLGYGVIWPMVLVAWFPGPENAPFRTQFAYGAGMVGWLIIAAMLSTLRSRTGFRGVHGLVSGTRVVRWDTSSVRHEIEVPTVLARPVERAERFGPFETIGVLGSSGSAELLLARDRVLHRNVWVRLEPGESRGAADGVSASRPTRVHFLQAGQSDGRSWEAYEAIHGAPLPDVARAPGGIGWELGRRLLLDLTSELLESLREDSLPDPLTLAQVWVDRGGRLKLLSQPIETAADPPGEPEESGREDASGEEAVHPAVGRDQSPRRPVGLLRDAAVLVSREQVLPGGVQEFLAELARRPEDAATLEWARAQLEQLISQRVQLRWDDRLGTMAASVGTEMTCYLMTLTLLSGVVWALPLPPAAKWLVPLTVVVAAVLGLGAWFRGGPIFRLTGVDVHNQDGGAATRLQCAWRNIVAWFPYVFFYAIVSGASAKFITESANAGQSDPMAFTREMINVLPAMCGGECLMVLFLIGAIYAVINPARGLQDMLAGTRLLPRR